MNETTSEPASGRLELTLLGPLAGSVLRVLDDRYEQVTTSSEPGSGTVVTIDDIDQAGERAVLNLLWDTGHQIRSLWRRES